MARYRGSTVERGLGGDHQKERRRLLPLAVGKPCPMCGQPMLAGQPLDLDHVVPRVFGGHGERRIAHRMCNRAAGARLGNRLRRAKRLANSRAW